MEWNKEELDEELVLLESLKRKEIKAFMELYRTYGDDLLIYSFMMVENRSQAIRFVEDLFERLWNNPCLKDAQPPLYSFLTSELDKICSKEVKTGGADRHLS